MYLSDFEAKDFDLVRYLAGQAVPFPVVDIKRLPGTIAHNYEVNHKYIVKLPGEFTDQEDWLRQSQLAPVLQQNFTFQIPHPQIKTLHMPDHTTILSSSYPKIEGICLSDDLGFSAKDRPFKVRFFEQLSDAAAQIHAVPLKNLPLQLPTRVEYLEKCFFKNIPDDTYLLRKLFRKLLHSSFLGFGKSGLRTSLLAHTDLHSGNVLLNDKNELVAVLDFDTLVRGDRFLEFRPNLYADPLDIRLFQKIYQERTNVKVDTNEIHQQEIMQDSLFWFCNLYRLYRIFPTSERDEKIKENLKNMSKKSYENI